MPTKSHSLSLSFIPWIRVTLSKSHMPIPPFPPFSFHVILIHRRLRPFLHPCTTTTITLSRPNIPSTHIASLTFHHQSYPFRPTCHTDLIRCPPFVLSAHSSASSILLHFFRAEYPFVPPSAVPLIVAIMLHTTTHPSSCSISHINSDSHRPPHYLKSQQLTSTTRNISSPTSPSLFHIPYCLFVYRTSNP